MRLALLALNILLSCALSAQLNGKYTFRHIGISEGLLHSTIIGITQDEKGYMWFLTQAGLQRYDGHSFVNYPQVLDVNPGGFSLFLYADQKGSLIMSKGGKYIRFDLNSHRFTAHTAEDLFKNEAPVQGVEYIEDSNRITLDSRLWIMYQKNSDTIITSALNYNLDLKPATCWQAFDSTTGDFYSFEKWYDIQVWNPVSNQRISSARDTFAHPLFKEWNKIKQPGYDKMMIDSKRRIWFISYNHHVYRYDLNKDEMKYFSLKVLADKLGKDTLHDIGGIIHFMLEDRQQNIWLATAGVGLLLLDQENDDFLSISSSEKIIHGLRYNYDIRNIFQDRDGNIWLGTDRGINVFNPYDNYFQIIRHVEEEKKSIRKFDIMDVKQTSQGEILVGTWDGGISIYDSNWTFVRNVIFDEIRQLNQVWCFIEHDDGTIWAGCNGGYLHKYDPVTREFTTERPPETMNSTILRMTKDKYGNIYLALRNGKIAFWNKKESKFQAFDDRNNINRKHAAFYQHIFIDQSGRCWYASDDCLLEYDAKQLTFINSYCPSDSSSPYDIRSISQLNDSTLIIGFRANGIYLFNVNSHQFSRPGIQDAISHSTVNAIKQDEDGNLWLCAGNVLYKSNRDLSGISKINLGYNALTSDFSDLTSIHSLDDGRWVTSTPSEIICFDPNLIRIEETEKKDVLISGLTIMKESVNVDSILSTQVPVELPYDQNFFSIEFTALEYLNAFDFNYSYRLKGIEQDWNTTSTKQFVEYTDIKPGEYVFEVKATYGSHESSVTSLPITITPPWWSTWWFRSICIGILAALGYLVFKKRIQAIRKQAELKQRISETEMMALRAQMNPHFIFNCLNGIDAMIHSDDKYRATMYLNKFAKLIRNVLESSKQNKVTLTKDLETLQLYIDLEVFRHRDKFSAVILTGEELLQEEFTVPPLIIQPYVENAILHGLRNRPGKDGRLIISVKKEADYIVYRIEDNGVGRKSVDHDPHNGNSGYGMQMSMDRVKLFNEEEVASVEVTDLESNGKPTGTVVQVRLKIHER